jgi:hypothetical protein
VSDGAGYTFRVYPTGVLKVVGGPKGVGETYYPDDKDYAAVMGALLRVQGNESKIKAVVTDVDVSMFKTTTASILETAKKLAAPVLPPIILPPVQVPSKHEEPVPTKVPLTQQPWFIPAVAVGVTGIVVLLGVTVWWATRR